MIKKSKEYILTKFLGVMIDAKLNWKEHIGLIRSKLSRSLAIIYKASQYLDKKSLYTLYCSLFLPYMSYCLEVWGNTYVTNMMPIYSLQKKAVHIICKFTKLTLNILISYFEN